MMLVILSKNQIIVFLASMSHCLFPATVVVQDLFDEVILEFIRLVICLVLLCCKVLSLILNIIIIGQGLCILETRDIVYSWLFGSLFVTTKFYHRN